MIDTHCHIHDSEFYAESQQREAVYTRALENGVQAMVCIGTDAKSSREAVEFAKVHEYAFATIGIHPHDAKDGLGGIDSLLGSKKLVGIGEIGLDYYYNHSPRDDQIALLEAQLQLAVDNNLPVSFHVREAYDDFWPIVDNFSRIRGVLHSFTDTKDNMERAVTRGLHIGVNGIATFTKDEVQRAMFAAIPLSKMLLETDAPFLTPKPFRGKINEPAYVVEVAKHMAIQLDVSSDLVLDTTTQNARALFSL